MKAGLNSFNIGTQQISSVPQINLSVSADKDNDIPENAPTDEMMEDIMKWS